METIVKDAEGKGLTALLEELSKLELDIILERMLDDNEDDIAELSAEDSKLDELLEVSVLTCKDEIAVPSVALVLPAVQLLAASNRMYEPPT